jgi:RHS repeat-associated protein
LQIGKDIIIPLWSQQSISSGLQQYQIQEFGIINLTAYKLKGKVPSISFIYKGIASCGNGSSGPVAENDNFITVAEAELSIVLSASTQTGQPITYRIVDSPVNGSLVGNNENYTYLSNAGFTGIDTFTFKANDSVEDSALATISIEVLAPTPMGQCELYPITVPYSLVSTSNIGDSFVDIGVGDAAENFNWLSWNGGFSSYYYRLMMSPPGNSDSYTNPSDIGDTFLEKYDSVRGLYQDGSVDNATISSSLAELLNKDIIIPLWSQIDTGFYRVEGFAKVNLTAFSLRGQSNKISFAYRGLVNCKTNGNPVAIPASVQTHQSIAVTVLANATDPESDLLTYQVEKFPDNGVLVENGVSFTYTPNENFFGIDSFNYRASDTKELSNEVVVTVDVLESAFINNQYTRALENVDVQGDPLSFELLQFPVGMSVDANGVITWNPQESNEGPVYVEVLITDINGDSSVYSFTLNVTYPDIDKDGILDNVDLCANTHLSESVDTDGCSPAQLADFSRFKASKLPQTGSDFITSAYDDAYYRSGVNREFSRDESTEVVIDHATNLKWADDLDVVDKSLGWESANDYCSNLETGGITDWRLPNVYEISTLINFTVKKHTWGYHSSPVFDIYKMKLKNGDFLWSSGNYTTKVYDAELDEEIIKTYVYVYIPSNGGAHIFDAETEEKARVRCVSGEELAPIKERAGYNISFDRKSRLMWASGWQESNKWSSSVSFCENFNGANSNDWRVANFLESIYLDSKYPSPRKYWTSTVMHDDTYGNNAYGLYRGTYDSPLIPYVVKLTASAEGNNRGYYLGALCVRDFVPPVAVSGGDRTIVAGEPATFDASASQHSNGTIVGYRWVDITDSPYDNWLSDDAIFTTSSLTYGQRTIELTVTDEKGVYTKETFSVNVLQDPYDLPPVANAGPDKLILTGSVISLDGSGSSDDNGIVLYEWYEGDRLLASKAMFTESSTYRAVGSYTFELKVTDVNGSNSMDTVTVTIQPVDNVFPVANAGQDQIVSLGSVVTLDATASSDNLGVSQFHWYLEGSWVGTGALFDYTGLAEGTYNFLLHVFDSSNNSSSDTVDITVLPQDILPPVVIAGEDQVLPYGVPVTLDGSASTDNQSIASYRWELNSTTVSNESIYSPTGLLEGVYTYTLWVEDYSGNTASGTVTITILPQDITPPVAVAGSDQFVRVGTSVFFDGSMSSDNHQISTFEWTLAGFTLSNSSHFTKSDFAEGAYTLELTTTDMSGNSSVDTVSVTVYPQIELQQCAGIITTDDSNYADEYPLDDIAWSGATYTDVVEIENAFNYARSIDKTIHKLLKMPTQSVWDSWTSQQKGLFLINSEREARGIKPYEGVSPAVVNVASSYADYLLSNNEIITHYRSSDNADWEDRLKEDTAILNNHDGTFKENIFSMVKSGVTPSESEVIVAAIYWWTYSDKYPYSGKPWGHRDFVLKTGLYENSGASSVKEGLIGFGIATGSYEPGTTPPTLEGGIVVLNHFDPSSSWDHSSTVSVDLSNAHQCYENATLEVDSINAPSSGLKALSLTPGNIALNPGDTVALQLTGLYDDGSSLDLTSYANFVPGMNSVISVQGGLVTALTTGFDSLSANFNGRSSNSIAVLVENETDITNLTDTFAEDYLQYLPTNGSIDNYDPKAFSLFVGLVVDKDGYPLPDVNISFHDKPEFGSVLTDVNGRFILAGEAGARTLVYAKDSHLTVHRSIISASNAWASLDDVTLLPVDTLKTAIDLSSGLPQIHQSTVISDEFGQRSTTLVFNGVNSATVTGKDGSTRQLTDFFVRATEYELPSSMPADLPQETAFTYCSELAIPGVGDDESVTFDSPVDIYVDNFLNFAVGEIVPMGYYDRIEGEWKSEDNGVVVKLLDSNQDGVIDGLDYTGDDVADDIDGDGQTSDEVVGLATYPSGKTYWRGSITHFSPHDLNWSANADGRAPVDINANSKQENIDENQCVAVSSYIKPKSLVLHEDIAITGTGLTLHYSSQRTHGYHHKISANVSGIDLPAGVVEMIALLEIGGNRFEQSFAPSLLKDVEFVWDGTDPSGELIHGFVRGRISIGYKYQSEYYSSGNAASSGSPLSSFPTAWAQWGSTTTSVVGREDIIRWSNGVVTVLNAPESQIANGWALSNHHMTSPFNMVYKGNGDVDEIESGTNVLRTGVTQSQYVGDDGYYQKGGLDIDYSIDESGVLIDNVTQLKWQYVTDRHAKFRIKPEAINYCANLNLGDNSQQWRLPTEKEIGYVIDKSATNQGYPLFTIEAKSFWSARTANYNNLLLPVNCVSGETLDVSYAQGLQRNNSDEVVIDEQNGLMWQDDISTSSATYTWDESIEHCESLTHAGYSDWRLPNINELIYVLPNTAFINQTSIPNNELWKPGVSFRKPYWTSTPNILNMEEQAWAIESASYIYHGYNKSGEIYYARCVRDDLTRNRSPYVFDHKGRHIKTVDMSSGVTLVSFHYDSEDRLITIKDRFENTITINRDASGVATEIVSPDGYTTKLTVDQFNDLTEAEYADGARYSFVYQDSLMTEELDLRGNLFTRSFDSTGRIYQSRDPEGGVWDFFSNKDPNTKDLTYGYSTAESNYWQSLITLLPNGDKQRTTTEPDSTIHVLTTQADELKETMSAASINTVIDKVIDPKTAQEIPHLITTTMPSGLKSLIQLDKTYAENGTDTTKTTLTVTQNGNSATVVNNTLTGMMQMTSAANRIGSYQYDPLTQLPIKEQVSGLQEMLYQYDSRGRIKSITAGDRISTFSFDDQASKGALTSVTDAEGHMTAFEYDILGRLNKTVYPDGRVLEQSYDSNGNLASLTPPGRPVHVFNYNSVDKETDYTPPSVTGVSTPQTIYDYDRDRKLTSITRPDSQQLLFNYTTASTELASIDIPRGRYSYHYDTHGYITNMTAPDSGSIDFVYDGGLLLSQTWSGVVNGAVSQSFSEGFVVNQQCVNAASCVDILFDVDNLLTQVGDLTYTREAQKAGLVNASSLFSINATLGHNNFGELDSETVKYNDSSLFVAGYTRDKLGRITQRDLTIYGVSQNEAYDYDQSGRLTTVTKADATISYSFDDNGNRLTKQVVDANGTTLSSGTYDDQDRLLTYNDCSYQYTANGELKQKRCGAGVDEQVTLYQYDVLGNLLKVTLPDATIIDYLIDASDRRIGKKVNGNLQQGFLYGDKLNPVAELDASNNVVSRFVYGVRVNVPEYMIKAGITYKIISDHLGSPRLVVNAQTGVIAQRLDYDEFGMVIEDTNPGFQPFGFAGGLYDVDTGLTRFGARDYDAFTGRWTNKDPIRFAGGDSNLYGYVLGDPVQFIDITGFAAEPTTQIKIGGRPMTISGPYKAPPGILDKIGYIGVSKLIVEKYTFKVLKVNPLTGALTANPVGLFIFGVTGGPGLATCQGLYCDGNDDGFADFFYEYAQECRNAN